MAENDDYGVNDKKIMFYDTDKRHADLKIRLHHDGLTQSGFFRMLITGYLEQDSELMSYIDRYKEENEVQSKAKRKKINKMMTKGRELESSHGLKDSEVESIFDLIQQEHPEL